MTTLFDPFRKPAIRAVAAAMLSVGLVAATMALGTPVSAHSAIVGADSTINCAEPVTSAPSGPATVSATSTSYGRVLVIGAGDYAACWLYLLTSDRLHALTGAAYACSDGPNPTGAPCDTVLWPALLTKGAPIAGRGVNPTLLGTFPVYTLSTDSHRGRNKSACNGTCAAVYWPPVLTSGRPVAGPGVDGHALGTIVRPDGTHQVTYKGRPLYLFYKDAYIEPISGTGTQGIYGAGVSSPWGVFNTIPRLP
jgi:predicted lipoprotein with Yx(FWY)xxD motif